MMRTNIIRVPAVLALLLLVSGCGATSRLGFGDKPDETSPTPASLERPNTATTRSVQVAWTAARAQFCAFGMNKEKLRSDYLAYEGSQGATPEQVQGIARSYDTTYEAFYTRIRGIPNYCSRAQIEDIRPDINRHLRGDYTPSARKPAPSTEQNVALPRSKDNVYKEYDKDPGGHFSQ